MKLSYPNSVIFFFFLVCYSCGVKRHVPAGKKLYDGAVIRVERAGGVKQKASYFKNNLANITAPKKNKELFGEPHKVWWWYFIGTPKKQKGFKAWIRRRLGEEPVFDEKMDPQFPPAEEGLEGLVVE